MDPSFAFSYSGMEQFTEDLPPQAPIYEQPQEQLLDADESLRQPNTEWTVYSMDVSLLDQIMYLDWAG